MPRSREEFVEEAAPTLQTYVERFAGEVPVSEPSEFANEWRRGKVARIVWLCAYEGWARRERLKTKGS